MIPFNYHHLYYFYVIAEEGSVTRAAEKLRLAQSSLSMQLAQFEAFLEKKLFIREGRRLYLTEEGSHVLDYAKAIFDLGEELSDSLSDRARKGQLRIQIGISSFIPKSFVDGLLMYLLKQKNRPGLVIVEKNLDGMLQDLAAHKLDMILNDLACHTRPEQGLENHLIARIPVALCAVNRIARTIRRIPQDLNHAPMILPTAQASTYHALQEYFLAHRIKPDIIGEIQDIELVRRLVLNGKGIAPLNELTIHKGPAKEKLNILGKPNQLNIFDSIYLIRKKRRNPHPLVESLLKKFNP